MKASIITIGNELVAGFTIDTNSSWIGQRFFEHGVFVNKKVSIPDEASSIRFELDLAISDKSNFIVLTGGLGPTHDDITAKVISEYFGLKKEIDHSYLNVLKKKFISKDIEMPSINFNQAYIYTGTNIIPNVSGSARGLIIKKNKSTIFVLPGVPFEMKQMFIDTVEKKYLPRCNKKNSYTLRSMGITESILVGKVEKQINFWEDKLFIAFLPSHMGVDIRLTIDFNNKINLDAAVLDFKKAMGKYFYGMDSQKLEEIVLNRLRKKGKTLAVAESCTGGKLSSFITSIPGSSDVFKGAIVAYNNQLKIKILGVEEADIDKRGAVSQEVAEQMARGVRDKCDVDIGIGITGISGPDGACEHKPLGLVYIALADGEKTVGRRFILIDKRKLHQEMTSYVALDMVRKWVYAK